MKNKENSEVIARCRAALWLIAAALGWFVAAAGEQAATADSPTGRRNYHFDGPISREVLENYLSRAITMQDLNTGIGNPEDNIRMLTNIGAKFAGRAMYMWGSEQRIADPAFLARGRDIAERAHKADPEMVLQGAVYEYVTEAVGRVPVPAWVFEEFKQKPEQRNFIYKDMLFPNASTSGRGSTPDITRPETKLWFFFLAASYIDIGMEAIHFGQLELVGKNDPDRKNWWELLQHVRGYAAKHARRHWVICDAHVPSGGPVLDGKLLLDSHAFPLRPKEVADSPQKAILEMGFFDSIYGRSKGGITPSGWKCEHLPYMVEVDNWGASRFGGQASQTPRPNYWVWGYDEMSWFGHQPEAYRNEWLRYAFNWLKEHDSNGFLEMPGSRVLHDGPPDPANSGRKIGWYFANTPGPACPKGFNQEETIKAIWREDASPKTSQAAPVQPVPYRVAPQLKDAAEALSPAALRLDGWLGARIDANEANRLRVVDTVPLLAGYHQKPGSHPWIGEHIGKWLHAATLAWVNTGDAALKEKLDRVAAELIGCQEADGYLGTYVPEKRFGTYKDANWDVWSHKYNLIGLLTYYQYTGNEAALTACRRMGDLLIRTFPARRSILAAGTHVGMAATSVLEPMVLLYRQTGEPRYLDFASYIVQAWDEPDGPRILSTLLAEKTVNKVANGKAYEMLSNLVGLCELARATGDRRLLAAVTIAWEDIALKRLYLTGGASSKEHFHDDYELPNRPSDNICETCVTTTWIQLNWQLLRLTGEAKYGQELERAFYNHLAAAQNPRGDDWCYYTPLEGRKPYDKGITCCHSSGPRAMALAPLAAYFKMEDQPLQWDVLAVSTLESSRATLELGGQTVTVEQRSEFPRRGRSELTLRMAHPARFAVRFRIPFWSRSLNVHAAGADSRIQDGWVTLQARPWQDGDRISLEFDLALHLIRGEHGNTGRAAWAYGPFVLAYDQALNPGLPTAAVVKLAVGNPMFTLLPDEKTLAFTGPVAGPRPGENLTARFVPYADAGAGGGTYRVWLRAPWAAAPAGESLLAGGRESQSRQGQMGDGISDGDPETLSDTYDNRPAADAWFAVTLEAPVTLKRVVFMHGKTFHDGGWFDASAGKPRVQVQREAGGTWETLGELGDYPGTTATDNGRLKAGAAFTLRLASPVKAVGVRVIGTPSRGDAPRQAFASCAELQAFND